MIPLPQIALYGAIGVLAVLTTLFLINKPVLVIYLQIIYCSVVFFMISSLHAPQLAKYLTDIFTLLLLLQMFLKQKKGLDTNVRAPLFCILLFTLVCLTGFVGNRIGYGNSFVFFFWGIRMYYRCFIFFWACIVFLKSEDITNLLKVLVALLPVNAVVCSIQKFVYGYGVDTTGGLFGTTQGCDGLMNLYLLIVCTVLIMWYKKAKIGIGLPILGICLTLYIAALGELKVLFFEVPAILLVAALFPFPSRRMLLLVAAGATALLLMITLFITLYPVNGTFFNKESIQWYTSDVGYSGEGSLNRLTAGSSILANNLETFPRKLFGIGLGNGDRFLNLTSPFYAKYFYLHYNWFMYAFLLVETGITGLVAYSLFFIAVLYDSFRIYRRTHQNLQVFCMISALMCLLTFPLLIYNASMHSEACYFLFFVMAIPYIIEKETNRLPN